METHEIDLVQQSFPALQVMSAEAAFIFYRRLGQLDPSLRHRIRGSSAQLSHRLVSTVHLAITNLDRLEHLDTDLTRIARRLRRLGIGPRHYSTMGAALLLTVEHLMGRLYTRDIALAWSKASQIVMARMIHASMAEARQHPVAA